MSKINLTYENGTFGTSGVDGRVEGFVTNDRKLIVQDNEGVIFDSSTYDAGSSGTSGVSGSAGESGTSGTSGVSGTSGESGTSGTSGLTGSSGTSGANGQNGISAGRIYYFNLSQNSDISPYKTLAQEPTTGGTQSTTVSVPGTSTALIQEFITPQLGFNVIPSGVQRFYLYYTKPATNDNIAAYLTLQLADVSGAPIGTLITSQLSEIGYNAGNPDETIIEVVFPTTNIDPTNRMIVKLYGQNNDATAHNLVFTTENGYYSFVVTSVAQTVATSGTSGTSGETGSSGTSGQNGTNGTTGTSGSSGESGTSGTSGVSGTSGESGTSGTSGLTGSSGTSGENGLTGSSGTSGRDGFAIALDTKSNSIPFSSFTNNTYYYSYTVNFTLPYVTAEYSISVNYDTVANANILVHTTNKTINGFDIILSGALSSPTDTIDYITVGYGESNTLSTSGTSGLSGSSGTSGIDTSIVNRREITTSEVLLTSDGGKMIVANSTNNLTITIPTNASVPIPVGTQILLQRSNTGEFEVLTASGVTLNAANGKLLAKRYSVAGIIKEFTDTWVIMGDTK